jgi:hypothetical protein
VGIDQRARVEGFGGENRKPSRGGLVLANTTWRVVNLGVMDTFWVGYTGVEKLGGKDRPGRKGGCIGLTTQNRAAGAQFLRMKRGGLGFG